SCELVRQFLVAELAAGRIDHLVLNHRNVGEGNGTLQVLHSAPGRYVAFCDSDVYHEAGWLEAQLAVARAFPKVGTVGGRPLRGLREKNTSATREWLLSQSGIEVTEGEFIEPEWTQQHLQSCGLTGNERENILVQRANEKDLRVT